MPTVRIHADEARSIRKDFLQTGRDGREMLVKLARAPSSWDAAERSARFVMTSQSVDRYGDVVVTAGLDTTEFEKNPVAFLSHRSGEFSIGQWDNLKKVRSQPPRLEGDLVLHEAAGPIKEIDQAAWMLERGYMRAASIGFLPDFNEIEKVLDDGGNWTGGLQFNKAELIECSLCGVPANRDTLAKSLEGGANFARAIIDDVLDHWARGSDGEPVERAAFEGLYRIVAKSEQPSVDVEKFLAEMNEDDALKICERYLGTKGRLSITRERNDAIDRAARQNRLAEKRKRDLEIIRARAGA
jgi:hypothetical protein